MRVRRDRESLAALVDKSLLTHSDDRYRMLETIREYALERLDEQGERDAITHALAEHLVSAAPTRDAVRLAEERREPAAEKRSTTSAWPSPRHLLRPTRNLR